MRGSSTHTDSRRVVVYPISDSILFYPIDPSSPIIVE
jgi:hypothetical protein